MLVIGAELNPLDLANEVLSMQRMARNLVETMGDADPVSYEAKVAQAAQHLSDIMIAGTVVPEFYQRSANDEGQIQTKKVYARDVLLVCSAFSYSLRDRREHRRQKFVAA